MMSKLENLKTPDLKMQEVGEAEAVLTKYRNSVDVLKEDVEFTKLNERYEQLMNRTKILFKRYEKALWKNPLSWTTVEWSTVVFDEWGLQVYDKEKGTYYALIWYDWFRWKSRNRYHDSWKSPKLLIFTWRNQWDYELDKTQYLNMLNKIEEVLNREERQIKELEKKKGTWVDDLIRRL